MLADTCLPAAITRQACVDARLLNNRRFEEIDVRLTAARHKDISFRNRSRATCSPCSAVPVAQDHLQFTNARGSEPDQVNLVRPTRNTSRRFTVPRTGRALPSVCTSARAFRRDIARTDSFGSRSSGRS